MPRKPKAGYDKRAGCWASTALGEARTDRNGKTYRPKVHNRELTHPTRDNLAAQAWLHAELEKLRKGMKAAAELGFEALTEHYLQDAEPRLGPEAYTRAEEHLSRFGNWPGPTDPNRMDLRPARLVTRLDAEKFRDAMLASGASASYVADALLKTLKACFRWAVSVEVGKYPGLPLRTNPLIGLTSPVVPRRKPRQVNPVQVARFLRWAWRRAIEAGDGPNGRHARSAVILFLVLRDTGARPKDWCVAEWEDWKVLSDGWAILRLPAWKWKNGAKTGEDRIIGVPPHCVRRIEALRSLDDRHTTRIFTHRRSRGSDPALTMEGVPWTTLDHARKRKGDTKSLQQWFKRLREAGEAAGYPLPEGFRLYFNRSAYITEARRRGVNDVQLAKALGTSVRMLDRSYTDMDESDVLGAARAAITPKRDGGGA